MFGPQTLCQIPGETLERFLDMPSSLTTHERDESEIGGHLVLSRGPKDPGTKMGKIIESSDPKNNSRS